MLPRANALQLVGGSRTHLRVWVVFDSSDARQCTFQGDAAELCVIL